MSLYLTIFLSFCILFYLDIFFFYSRNSSQALHSTKISGNSTPQQGLPSSHCFNNYDVTNRAKPLNNINDDAISNYDEVCLF